MHGASRIWSATHVRIQRQTKYFLKKIQAKGVLISLWRKKYTKYASNKIVSRCFAKNHFKLQTLLQNDPHKPQDDDYNGKIMKVAITIYSIIILLRIISTGIHH
jgi:hypothetical protein